MAGGACDRTVGRRLWWNQETDDARSDYLDALESTNATTCWRAMLEACTERNI